MQLLLLLGGGQPKLYHGISMFAKKTSDGPHLEGIRIEHGEEHATWLLRWGGVAEGDVPSKIPYFEKRLK